MWCAPSQDHLVRRIFFRLLLLSNPFSLSFFRVAICNVFFCCPAHVSVSHPFFCSSPTHVFDVFSYRPYTQGGCASASLALSLLEKNSCLRQLDIKKELNLGGFSLFPLQQLIYEQKNVQLSTNPLFFSDDGRRDYVTTTSPQCREYPTPSPIINRLKMAITTS